MGTIVITTGFVVGILILVVVMFRQDVNMVTDHYYEKDLKFELQRDRIARANRLSEKPGLSFSAPDKLILTFPVDLLQDGYSGELQIYRPSDDEYDRFVPLSLQGDTLQVIHFASQPSGLWRGKLNWTNNGEEYYLEQPFFVP